MIKLILTFLSVFLVINLCNLKQKNVDVITETFKLSERVDTSKYLFYNKGYINLLVNAINNKDIDIENNTGELV